MLLDTPHGQARLTAHPAAVKAAQGSVVVLHGAGTDSSAPVLMTIADDCAAAGLAAFRLDQPYTTGGRRPPAPSAQLDAVLRLALARLDPPFVVIGRSSGSRVACRVSAEEPAIKAVVALGYPLAPPRNPGQSRAGELAAAAAPVTVLQGSRDEFGAPEDISALGLAHVTVVEIAGADHMFGVRKLDGRSAHDVLRQVSDLALAAARLSLH